MGYNRFEDPRHKKWAYEVKKRDNFKCRVCGNGGYLNSHHCNSWDMFKQQRFDVSNGITLCPQHHEMFHDIYGHGKNTYCQFEEFMKIISLIEEIVKEKNE